MDPTLSTADAHVLFGKLYRKIRSVELQQKVDEIVSSTSDVFVRIKKIEELDENEQNNNKGVEIAKQPIRQRSSGGGSGSPSKRQKKNQAKKKNKTKSDSGNSLGLFARLFGTDISRWGAKTATLEGGVFSRNPTLSPNIIEMFKSLSDEQIKSTVAVFKATMGSIWEQLEPGRYNVLIAAYQFIVEFVKAEAIIRSAASSEDLSTATIRLQKSYAMMINFPNYKDVLLKDFTGLVAHIEKLKDHLPALQATLKILLSLDDRKPGIKNSILAMYVITRKKLMTWDQICQELKVGVPQTQQYRAPEVVMELIHKKIRSLKSNYQSNIEEAKEAQKIKQEYLGVNSNGKLNVEFLDPIVFDVLRKSHNEQKLSPEFVKNYKSEPHKLLYCIMKDLELNAVFLLVSTVMTKGDGQHSEEVMIFKPGIFAKTHAKFLETYRVLESFMRVNKEIVYSFADYLQDLRIPPKNAQRREFLRIATDAMKIFGLIVSELQIILTNHQKAIELEKFGKLTDTLKATKAAMIDSLDSKPRFIPYGEREIFASSRMNGMRVAVLIEEYVKYLYNYLYIFRDPEIVNILSSAPAKLKENERIKEELLRMGVSVETN